MTSSPNALCRDPRQGVVMAPMPQGMYAGHLGAWERALLPTRLLPSPGPHLAPWLRIFSVHLRSGTPVAPGAAACIQGVGVSWELEPYLLWNHFNFVPAFLCPRSRAVGSAEAIPGLSHHGTVPGISRPGVSGQQCALPFLSCEGLAFPDARRIVSDAALSSHSQRRAQPAVRGTVGWASIASYNCTPSYTR